MIIVRTKAKTVYRGDNAETAVVIFDDYKRARAPVQIIVNGAVVRQYKMGWSTRFGDHARTRTRGTRGSR